MTRAIADTSVSIAEEAGRDLGELPAEIAVSVVTAAELELAVLRAKDTDTRARPLATLAQVRATYPLLPVDAETASCFVRVPAAELEAGRRIRRHDAWIAATALRHGVAVAIQDADFGLFAAVDIIRVRRSFVATLPGKATARVAVIRPTTLVGDTFTLSSGPWLDRYAYGERVSARQSKRSARNRSTISW